MRPFHLAIPTKNLKESETFYTDLLGCSTGRRADKWVDINFFGHQLSIHLKPEEVAPIKGNDVDGKTVPVRHFGIVLSWEDWHRLAERLKTTSISFIIEPYIRFKGEIGEQATMFFLDPSHNALEFKAFKDDNQIFAR